MKKEKITKLDKKTKKELICILTPSAPPNAGYRGGVKDWDYYYNKAGLSFLVNEISELLALKIAEATQEGYNRGRLKCLEQHITGGKNKRPLKEI